MGGHGGHKKKTSRARRGPCWMMRSRRRRSLGPGGSFGTPTVRMLPAFCLDYTSIGRSPRQTEHHRQAEEAYMAAPCPLFPKPPAPVPSVIFVSREDGQAGEHTGLDLGTGRRELIPIYMMIQTHSKGGEPNSMAQRSCSKDQLGRRSKGAASVDGGGGKGQTVKRCTERHRSAEVSRPGAEIKADRQGRAAVARRR